jgi:hypothetical protein
MNNQTQAISRLGIWPKFPAVKNYLKRYVLGVDRWEVDALLALKRYAAEGKFQYTAKLPGLDMALEYGASRSTSDLMNVNAAYRWQAIHSALSNEAGWQDVWQRSVAYHYLATNINFCTAKRSYEDFKAGGRPQFHSFLFIKGIGAHLGELVVLGWTDLAIQVAKSLRHWLDIENGVTDGNDSFGRRRTQHFVLRLISNWQGWPERNAPKCAYDEPLFNALIEHWRTDDMDLLTHLLLAACDRHTHQVREDNSKGEFFDLGTQELVYDPFEILAVLRLRQMHGLPNPVLDHPLMNTPLGQLPDITPPYEDELLKGVITRARLEYPDL